MPKCKKCGDYRNILNEEGICIFCQAGVGGKSIEKKTDQYAIGKPLKSAATD